MSDFLAFARAHGLILDYIEADNRWRRYKTVDKPRKKNGAAVYDGRRGAVRNYATMLDFATWSDGNFEKVPMRDYREARRKSAAEESARHAKAAAEAARIVKASTLLTPVPGRAPTRWRAAVEPVLAHPYLVKKGLPDVPALVHEGFLIVPMRVKGEHHDELVNVQRISPEGEKRFLTGGRAKGAFHRLGPPRATEVWICEGFATGLSVHGALHAMYRKSAVVVCFSAGNLKYPGATHVIADNDASGAGAKAAEETGLPWVMPAEVGMDANDLHAREGLVALQALLRTVRARA
jgi:putative DNA primase/helicase